MNYERVCVSERTFLNVEMYASCRSYASAFVHISSLRNSVAMVTSYATMNYVKNVRR
jgi:hypothetical protein